MNESLFKFYWLEGAVSNQLGSSIMVITVRVFRLAINEWKAFSFLSYFCIFEFYNNTDRSFSFVSFSSVRF